MPARANTSGGTRTVSLSPADATLGKRRDKEARALYLNAVLQCSAGLVAARAGSKHPAGEDRRQRVMRRIYAATLPSNFFTE